VWESHVTWSTPVQSFVFLGLLVFELEPMYATSDGRTTDAEHRIMPPRRGHNKARYWSKIMIFSYPLHSTPPLWGFPSEYCHPVWYGMVWLTDSKKKLTIRLADRRVTYRQTDRQIDNILPRHSPRYSYEVAR